MEFSRQEYGGGGFAMDSSFQPPNDSHPYLQFTDGETEAHEDLGVSSVRHLAGLGEEPLLLRLASHAKRHFRAELVRFCACVCLRGVRVGSVCVCVRGKGGECVCV